MLLDVTWNQDDHSGEMLPEYHWYTEKPHPRIKCRNLLDDTGLTPQTFPDFQCLRGDPTDGIKGCAGVGEKGAADLVQTFGSAAGAIQAAKLGDPRIRESKQLALIEFEWKLAITRQLVTLRTDLELPTTTRL
jgi:DNA polymerase-1